MITRHTNTGSTDHQNVLFGAERISLLAENLLVKVLRLLDLLDLLLEFTNGSTIVLEVFTVLRQPFLVHLRESNLSDCEVSLGCCRVASMNVKLLLVGKELLLGILEFLVLLLKELIVLSNVTAVEEGTRHSIHLGADKNDAAADYQHNYKQMAVRATGNDVIASYRRPQQTAWKAVHGRARQRR